MTRPLHVAQVCLPSWGGSSAVAADLARALGAAGHRATVVSARPPPRLELATSAEDPVQWRAVAIGDHPALQHAGAQTVAMAGVLVQLAQAGPLDIIHVHYAVPHAAAAWLAQLTLGPHAPALVVSLHGTDASAVATDPRYAPLMREALSQAAALTAPSRYLADVATANLGLARAPWVVPNFIDTGHFLPAVQRNRAVLERHFPHAVDGSPVLLHLSNFRPVKRTWALIPLLAALQAHRPCRLLLVGDGPDREAVQAAAHARGLSDRCTVLSPRADCLELLQHADLFLLPSASEGFGLAALEAMACGTPVVATAVGALPEVIDDGATGLLSRPDDADDLCACVARLLANPQQALSLGRAARQAAVARFGADAGLKRWLAIYDAALDGPTSCPSP